MLRLGALRTTFPPIVDLETSEVVGFETQVRGPDTLSFDDPATLRSAARSMGITADLDAVRWRGALNAAAAASLPSELPLFIAVDPDSFPALPRLSGRTAVVQIDESALIQRPVHVLRAVARARRLGWAVALNHVGVHPESLVWLSVLEPDVITLDRTLVSAPPCSATARVANAVTAQAERTGAIVMCAGIDTDYDRRSARALGARVGVGRLLDRATRLRTPNVASVSLEFRTVPDRATTPLSSPFQLVSAGRDQRPCTKELLVEISKDLEALARKSSRTAMLLGTFENRRYFTGRTRNRWEQTATDAALVAVFAADMNSHPAAHVRGTRLAGTDPARREWNVVVLTPHSSAVLAACDRGDGGPDMDRRFDYVLSQDRSVAIACVRILLGRMPAETGCE